MSASLEILIIELGILRQPLQESFKKSKSWVTWSWMVSLWETCNMFRVRVKFQDVSLKIPREGDIWLIILFMEAGFTSTQLHRLNRVR